MGQIRMAVFVVFKSRLLGGNLHTSRLLVGDLLEGRTVRVKWLVRQILQQNLPAVPQASRTAIPIIVGQAPQDNLPRRLRADTLQGAIWPLTSLAQLGLLVVSNFRAIRQAGGVRTPSYLLGPRLVTWPPAEKARRPQRPLWRWEALYFTAGVEEQRAVIVWDRAVHHFAIPKALNEEFPSLLIPRLINLRDLLARKLPARKPVELPHKSPRAILINEVNEHVAQVASFPEVDREVHEIIASPETTLLHAAVDQLEHHAPGVVVGDVLHDKRSAPVEAGVPISTVKSRLE
mmetsp:Transcript_17836/g.51295  ORF Transcript_17836/g.51295 Transcript_17836/m.51295 type:complete len:290 (-) Transcript_17836:243-1112(-)